MEDVAPRPPKYAILVHTEQPQAFRGWVVLGLADDIFEASDAAGAAGGVLALVIPLAPRPNLVQWEAQA